MGRKAGSKNKPKVVDTIQSVILKVDEVIDEWLHQEKTPQTVPSARPPKKKESKQATLEITLEPNEEETSSSGSQCVSDVTTKRVSGFINIQANPRGGFFTGADIHESVERAKQVASKQTITQVFIAFEVKS